MLKTPSPTVKKPKFDLSELDEKQQAFIPEPSQKLADYQPASVAPATTAVETDKPHKPAKVSRKKRKFAAMLGGSTAVTNDGMGAFQTPFGYSAAPPDAQQDDCKFLEDMNQITPSDQARQR